MAKNLIFVDDEELVLQGLQRMLRPMRDEWTMDFVGSGAAALAMMDEKAYDVIVTDMRMPGMDGAELLQKVQARSPNVARIILSGHAERSSAVRAAGLAHQFLSKPCDADELRRTVRRTCSLRDSLNNHELLERITSMGQIPSLPEVFEELRAEMNSSEPSIARAGAILAKDIGMSTKIIQIVNSSFFGLPRRVDSVTDAASLLGLDIIRDLVLSSAVFKILDRKNMCIPIEKIWNTGVACGTVARSLARKLGLDRTSAAEAVQAALLFDVGRVALAAQVPELYAAVVAEAEADNGVELEDVERKHLGCAHPEVGGYLLGLWGLPDSVVEAVTFHHAPQNAAEEKSGPVAVVYASHVLVAAIEDGSSVSTVADRLALIGHESSAESWMNLTRGLLQATENAA